MYTACYIKSENGCYRYISEWFQPRNRVSPIILRINAKILERNPVSQPTGSPQSRLQVISLSRSDTLVFNDVTKRFLAYL